MTVQEMFGKQVDLQYVLHGVHLPAWKPELLLEQVTGLVCEIGEVLHETDDWKSWKKNKKSVKYHDLVEEYADALHFFINIGLCLGIGADTLEKAFERKHEENKDRHERGY